jgi:hypothetical protein
MEVRQIQEDRYTGEQDKRLDRIKLQGTFATMPTRLRNIPMSVSPGALVFSGSQQLYF